MVKGRLDKNASTATSYSWLIWEKNLYHDVPDYVPIPWLAWIPPCRKDFEELSDYEI